MGGLAPMSRRMVALLHKSPGACSEHLLALEDAIRRRDPAWESVHKYNGRLKGSKGMLYRNVARKDGRVGRAEVAEAEVISDPHAWMAGMEDCSDS